MFYALCWSAAKWTKKLFVLTTLLTTFGGIVQLFQRKQKVYPRVGEYLNANNGNCMCCVTLFWVIERITIVIEIKFMIFLIVQDYFIHEILNRDLANIFSIRSAGFLIHVIFIQLFSLSSPFILSPSIKRRLISLHTLITHLQLVFADRVSIKSQNNMNEKRLELQSRPDRERSKIVKKLTQPCVHHHHHR